MVRGVSLTSKASHFQFGGRVWLRGLWHCSHPTWASEPMSRRLRRRVSRKICIFESPCVHL